MTGIAFTLINNMFTALNYLALGDGWAETHTEPEGLFEQANLRRTPE